MHEKTKVTIGLERFQELVKLEESLKKEMAEDSVLIGDNKSVKLLQGSETAALLIEVLKKLHADLSQYQLAYDRLKRDYFRLYEESSTRTLKRAKVWP